MNKALLQRLVVLLALLVVLVVVTPRSSIFPYDYRVGSTWQYETLYAQFDFPILKTEEELREERANYKRESIPYFKYSEEEYGRIINAVELLNLGSLRRAVLAEIRSIYSKGVLPDQSRRSQDPSQAEVIYIEKDKRAVKYPNTEILRQSQAKEKLLTELTELTDLNVDSLLKTEGVYDYIVPNIFYDENTSKLIEQDTNSGISLTSGYVNVGQLIVSEDELITAEIKQMLDSYKEEFESNLGYIHTPFLLWVGDFIILLTLLAIFTYTLTLCVPKYLTDNRFYFGISVFALFSIITLALSRIGGEIFLLIPFTLIILLFRSFFSPKESIILYAVSLLPLLVCTRDGVVLYVMYLGAGIQNLLTFSYFEKGWKQFIRALINYGILVFILLAFRASDLIAGNILRQIITLFFGSLLIVAGFPLLYLFERFFNLVSDSRLVELGDTSSDIMRQMEQLAPGTFQHSIQVMNMAETVARAVDVNPELVRVGALYHDLGKIVNPMCFVENECLLEQEEGSHSYHSTLTPLESAQAIIKHTEDGIELAKKYHLPKLIQDFIISHHGTTVVRYFYDKHLKEGGNEADRELFRYKGQKPHTKAQLILMLCDSMEAAARTIKHKTPEAFTAFTDNIVKGKMDEGQFDEVNITFAELTKIKAAINSYLSGLNHQRIVYPKKKL